MKLRISIPLLAALWLSPAGAAPPTITSFNPYFGSVGDTVQIYGSGFISGSTTVKFGGPGGATVVSPYVEPTHMEVHVPTGATTGLIYVSVVGQGSTLTATNFTVIGPEPYIASFIPPGGGGGTMVTITGTHFTEGVGGAPVVKFNGLTAGINLAAQTQLIVTAPTAVTSGPITVERSGLGTGTSAVPFYVNAIIKSFSPISGRRGTNVVIRGTNFLGATSVTFNTVNTTQINVDSTNQITAVVPLNATTGPLYVFTPAPNPGFTTSNFTILPTITGFTPNFGPPGTPVTISGENLFGATDVLFAGKKSTSVTSVQYGSLVATVPGGATNGVITVTTTNGTHTSAQLFYLPAGVSNFSPTNGPENTVVTITGSNFLGAQGVTFNGTAAKQFNVTNNTTIGAVVPASVITGPIIVSTPAGTVDSGSKWFYGAPRIDSFNPTHGLPGTRVTVSGVNFSNATQVLFNGLGASFTPTNGETIGATVPTNAQTGPITVIGPGGTNVSASAFTLDYTSDLAVSSSAPASVLLANDFTYVIVITNRGPYTATNVAFSDTLPGSVTFKFGSISPGGSLNTGGNPITGSFPSLSVSHAATITLTVTPQVIGSITNTANVTSGYSDPVPGNNTSVAVTDIYLPPVLSIRPSASNQVRIAWSVALSSYVLQWNSVLSSNSLWLTVTNDPQYIGAEKVVFDQIGSGAKFYRLKR